MGEELGATKKTTTRKKQASLGLRGYPPALRESISGMYQGLPCQDVRAVRIPQRAIALSLKSILLCQYFQP